MCWWGRRFTWKRLFHYSSAASSLTWSMSLPLLHSYECWVTTWISPSATWRVVCVCACIQVHNVTLIVFVHVSVYSKCLGVFCCADGRTEWQKVGLITSPGRAELLICLFVVWRCAELSSKRLPVIDLWLKIFCYLNYNGDKQSLTVRQQHKSGVWDARETQPALTYRPNVLK